MDGRAVVIVHDRLDGKSVEKCQYSGVCVEFDVFLTVYHSIELFQITNLMRNSFFL